MKSVRVKEWRKVSEKKSMTETPSLRDVLRHSTLNRLLLHNCDGVLKVLNSYNENFAKCSVICYLLCSALLSVINVDSFFDSFNGKRFICKTEFFFSSSNTRVMMISFCVCVKPLV